MKLGKHSVKGRIGLVFFCSFHINLILMLLIILPPSFYSFKEYLNLPKIETGFYGLADTGDMDLSSESLAMAVEEGNASIIEGILNTASDILNQDVKLKSDILAVMENQNAYESWPKLFYDADTDSLLTVYSSGHDHAGINKDIYLSKYKDGEISYFKVGDANGDSLKPIGIFKFDSKYVVFATVAEGWVDGVDRLVRFTSEDMITWKKTAVGFPFSDDAQGGINIDNVTMIDGMLFVNLSYYEDGKAYVCYSSNGGYTWERSEALTYSEKYVPCEFMFYKIDESIIMLARKGIAAEEYNNTPYFSISKDYGKTWSPFKSASGIPDSTASNLSMIKYSENKLILVYASRKEGKSGIYYTVTNHDYAIKSVFEAPKKIMGGVPSSDFGYPSCVLTPDGLYYVYYSLSKNDGTDNHTSIYLCKLTETEK